MKINMGSIDGIGRLIVAVAIGLLYFTGVIGGTPGILLLILGAVFALTALIGTCPLYLPFGINTRKKS